MIIQKIHNCKLIFFNLKYCSPPMDCGCPRGSVIKWMVFSYPSNLYHIIYKPWLTKQPPSRLSTGFFMLRFFTKLILKKILIMNIIAFTKSKKKMIWSLTFFIILKESKSELESYRFYSFTYSIHLFVEISWYFMSWQKSL